MGEGQRPHLHEQDLGYSLRPKKFFLMPQEIADPATASRSRRESDRDRDRTGTATAIACCLRFFCLSPSAAASAPRREPPSIPG